MRIRGEIITKRYLRRRNDHFLAGPVTEESGKRAPFHVRLLHEDEPVQIEALFFDEFSCELNILPSVGGTLFNEDAFARHIHAQRDARESISFGLVPQRFGDGSLSAGKDDERRPAFEK